MGGNASIGFENIRPNRNMIVFLDTINNRELETTYSKECDCYRTFLDDEDYDGCWTTASVIKENKTIGYAHKDHQEIKKYIQEYGAEAVFKKYQVEHPSAEKIMDMMASLP